MKTRTNARNACAMARKRFAENFGQALDRRGAIPSGYGRVKTVADLFGVSANTAGNLAAW